jgi:hypothetical protein
MRVFSKDEEVFGNYVTLMNVEFGYGQENIDQAKIPNLGYTKGKRNGKKKGRLNSPLSAQKTKHSGINHARMI